MSIEIPEVVFMMGAETAGADLGDKEVRGSVVRMETWR